MNHNETSPEPSKTDQEIAEQALAEIKQGHKGQWVVNIRYEFTRAIILSAITKSKRVSPSGEGEVQHHSAGALRPKDWLLSGGGGYEGTGDLRGVEYTGFGLVDMLGAYREYLEEFSDTQFALAHRVPQSPNESQAACSGSVSPKET